MTDKTSTNRILNLVALALHLVVGFLVVVSGLVAPPAAVGSLLGLWLVATIVGVRLRRRTGMALVVAVIMTAVWVTTILLGTQLAGWNP